MKFFRALKTADAVDHPTVAEMLAALPAALLLVDGDGRIVEVNAAAEALLNTSEGHLVGQALKDVLHLSQRFNLSADSPFVAYDIEVHALKDLLLHIDLTVSPLANYPTWRLLTLQSCKPAQRLSHSRDPSAMRSAINLAAMLAHEIKNPLSGIRGAAQLVASQCNDKSVTRMTNVICDEVDRVAALIDQMQDFTDTRAVASQPENIYPILDHVRALAKSGFASGITITDAYDPSLPLVMANRDALIQVLINLLKNASEAIDAATGSIQIATSYRHGVSIAREGAKRQSLPIEINIIDNGPGPPPVIIDNLFEPFISSKAARRGLGLALASKLMRDMGGTIQFVREGKPEHTVFRLLLPRAGDKV